MKFLGSHESDSGQGTTFCTSNRVWAESKYKLLYKISIFQNIHISLESPEPLTDQSSAHSLAQLPFVHWDLSTNQGIPTEAEGTVTSYDFIFSFRKIWKWAIIQSWQTPDDGPVIKQRRNYPFICESRLRLCFNFKWQKKCDKDRRDWKLGCCYLLIVHFWQDKPPTRWWSTVFWFIFAMANLKVLNDLNKRGY